MTEQKPAPGDLDRYAAAYAEYLANRPRLATSWNVAEDKDINSYVLKRSTLWQRLKAALAVLAGRTPVLALLLIMGLFGPAHTWLMEARANGEDVGRYGSFFTSEVYTRNAGYVTEQCHGYETRGDPGQFDGTFGEDC